MLKGFSVVCFGVCYVCVVRCSNIPREPNPKRASSGDGRQDGDQVVKLGFRV